MSEKKAECVEKMKRVVSHLNQAKAIMACGPLDYWLEKLVDHSEALIERFSPIKVGQRAKINVSVKCENGWRGCERDLAVGSVGSVVDVDFYKGKFWFDFVPDQQWWRANDGEYHVKERLNSYRLSESELVPLAVEIPEAVREMAEEFGKITEAELKASLDLLKTGRQQIPIPPAIQREVEEVIAERRGEQPPAKRREWWVRPRKPEDHANCVAFREPTENTVRVIAAPSEAEIEAAVEAGIGYAFRGHNASDCIHTAIRKLLGGGE